MSKRTKKLTTAGADLRRTMYRYRFTSPAVALLLFACLSLAACSRGAKAPPADDSGAKGAKSLSNETSEKKVLISGMKFQPATLTVNVGDTVEFTNSDLYPHTATAKAVGDLPAFDSGILASGASWRFVEKTKGTYDYICTLHPNMKGKLIVQ